MDSLHTVGEFVTATAEQAGLDEHAAYGLRLAVDEIATNAIVHGYQKAGQTGDLVLTAQLTDDDVCVVLEDSSPPYDPRQTPPPDVLDRAPEERPSGGFGVYLAQQGVDAFRYEYVDGVNRHIFMMNRTS